MGFIKELDTKTYVNEDYPDVGLKEIVIGSTEGCLVDLKPLFISETIELVSEIDSLVIPFTKQVIENNISNMPLLSLLSVKIVELPQSGFLYLEGVRVEGSIVFPYSSLEELKFISVKAGYRVARAVIHLKPVPSPISSWSSDLEIIFSVRRSNSLPQVDDNSVVINYQGTHVITLSDVLYNYHDIENDAFTYLEVYSTSGSGNLLFDNVVVSTFPLVVTKADLVAEKLKYVDTGAINSPKDFIINFTVYDT